MVASIREVVALSREEILKQSADLFKTHTPSKDNTTFHTINRLAEAISPSNTLPHHPELANVSLPHVESFNSIFTNKNIPNSLGLLDSAVENLTKKVIFHSVNDDTTDINQRNKLELWVSDVTVGKPQVENSKGAVQTILYPSECRERGTTYRAIMQARFNYRVNNGPIQSEIKSFGKIPIMVRSSRCNLEGKSPKQLVELNEDSMEFGGYFILNGIERLIRLLIVPRRNHPTAIVRSSFQKRGPTYSTYGVSIRSVRNDQTSQSITLHYCTDGEVTMRFSYKKNEYMVPVVLVIRALMNVSDRELFQKISFGRPNDTFFADRIELLLRSVRRFNVYTQEQCLAYLGGKFAVMLDSPDDKYETDVGMDFLRQVVLVHLDGFTDKADMLIFMLQKLYSLVGGECSPDNPDSPQHQEVLLGGHLYNSIIKEKIDDWLASIRLQIMTDIRRNVASVDFFDKKYISKAVQRTSGAMDIGKKLEYFLATGNLVSNTGLDLQQVSGYTIVAEKLNFYRYISHFRSIHRGSFFAELKTTTVRKLLPEAWGFLCPVHTPDGSPCGLLNHLSHTCDILSDAVDSSSIAALIQRLGVSQVGASSELNAQDSKGLADFAVSVQLDGKILGYCTADKAAKIARTLRHWKVTKTKNIPLDVEIGWVPPSHGGQYPGLFIFTTGARMMRPVKYLATGETDKVGSFEQVYMDIACLPEDNIPGLTTHQEIEPTNILSIVANVTPFSDFNQSPRNMYQCQMGKQSMGTPAHALPNRTDNKLYRLQTGQTPIVRPKLHDNYGFDEYPNGMNAVVAVISYTGYDMEDASILNKSAHERGYGYGTVYKGEFISLGDKRRKGENTKRFGLAVEGKAISSSVTENVLQFLDIDGLPKPGKRLTQGDPYYAYVDEISGKVTVVPYKSSEDGFVDQVRLIGSETDQELEKVHIKLRIPRSPIIGDKFSSRHGQKGVISQKWPSVDMPFSETGIIPDVIINPHAFPSRMTIGMFVESIAGKSGALNGNAQDATPWKFSEDTKKAADHFGEELAAAGFNFHGNEPMYSGITGEEFKADIYIGVVYYQRLRHMVSDKYQVRTVGPVHNVTQQPVKGRKRAGGIRFGEMERDSLLAHGVSFLLQDRLMNCSDYSQTWVCRGCGSLLSITPAPKDGSIEPKNISRGGQICKTCGHGKKIEAIAVPYVFRYLCSELVAMNVKLKLTV